MLSDQVSGSGNSLDKYEKKNKQNKKKKKNNNNNNSATNRPLSLWDWA